MGSNPSHPQNRLEDFFRTEDTGTADGPECTQEIDELAVQVAKLKREVYELTRAERRWMIAAIFSTAGLVFSAAATSYVDSHQKPQPQIKVPSRDGSQGYISLPQNPHPVAVEIDKVKF